MACVIILIYNFFMRYLPSKRYMIGLTIFFSLIVIIAGWLLVRANGYRVLFDPLRMVKTGVISVRVAPNEGVILELNDKTIAANEWDMKDLLPGRYTVKLTKDGYSPWEKTVSLDAGQAIRLHNLRLFLLNPLRSSVTEDSVKSSLEAILSKPERFQSDLQVLDNEIWAENHLVTRYSQPVSQAMWLDGKYHLLVLVGDSLRVIEVDGSHDLELVKIPAIAKSVRFAPLAGGSKMVLDVEGFLETIEITTPVPFLNLPSFQ